MFHISTQISEVTLALLRRLSVATSQEVSFNFLAFRAENNCSSVFRLDSTEKYSIENDTGFLIHDGDYLYSRAVFIIVCGLPAFMSLFKISQGFALFPFPI